MSKSGKGLPQNAEKIGTCFLDQFIPENPLFMGCTVMRKNANEHKTFLFDWMNKRKDTAVVRKVAADTKTQLVDVEQAYRNYLAEPGGHQPGDWMLDGMHPNTKGQQKVADMLWPVVTNMLKIVQQ